MVKIRGYQQRQAWQIYFEGLADWRRAVALYRFRYDRMYRACVIARAGELLRDILGPDSLADKIRDDKHAVLFWANACTLTPWTASRILRRTATKRSSTSKAQCCFLSRI